MAEPVSVRCPHCNVVLKLKNAAVLGKKVPCPKCHEPFVAKPVSAAAKAPTKAGAKPQRAAAPPAQAPKIGAAKKPQKPAKPKKGNSRKIAFIGGGVAGVAVLVGLVFLLIHLFSGSEPVAKTEPKPEPQPAPEQPKPKPAPAPSINLAYLPEDTELFVVVRVAELVNSAMIQPLLQSPEARKQIDDLSAKMGIGVSDIATLTYGMAGLSEQAAKAKQGPLGVMQPPDFSKQRLSVVLRTAKPIDLKRVIAAFKPPQPTPSELPAQTHGETAYYVIPGPMGGNGAVFSSDQTTLVVCPEAMVKELIDSAGKPLSQANLSFVDAKQHVVMAAVPKDPSMFAAGAPQPSGDASSSQPSAANKLADAAKGKVVAGALGITLTDAIAVQLTASCADADSAKSVQAALDAWLVETRGKLPEARKTMPEQFQKFADLAEQVLSGTKTSLDGTSVRLAATTPGSSMDTLKELPGALMSMWMMQGLAGAGQMPVLPADGQTFPGMDSEKQGPPVASVTEDGVQKDLYLSDKVPVGANLFPPPSLAEPPLIVTLDVSGEVAKAATAYGFLKVSVGQDDQGKSLGLIRTSLEQADPTNRFVPLDRTTMFFGMPEQPQDKIRLYFMLDRPTESAKQLSALEGSFQLMAGGERRNVDIPGVLKQIDKEIDNPELKAAGLTVIPSVMAENREKSLQVSVTGQLSNLAGVALVDSTGKDLDAQQSSMGAGEFKTYVIHAEQNLPADVVLRIVVLADQKPVTVPFKFQSVLLTAPSAKE